MSLFQSLRVFFIGLVLVLSTFVIAPAAYAGDPVIDAAKTEGLVGERVDGYLGLVTGNAEPAVRRKINEINAGRRAAYERLANQTGTTVEQVGVITGEKQIASMPAGQYYMNTSGRWIRK